MRMKYLVIIITLALAFLLFGCSRQLNFDSKEDNLFGKCKTKQCQNLAFELKFISLEAENFEDAIEYLYKYDDFIKKGCKHKDYEIPLPGVLLLKFLPSD